MDRYLVFGHPVRHSKSPFIHTLFARQTQQELEYGLAEPAVEEFATSLRAFFAQGGKGCNVTVPFKEQAFALVDRLSPRARRAGAVNTIKLTDDGVLLGDNTDGAGLVADLKAHGVALAGSRILLLGAGGAARGAQLHTFMGLSGLGDLTLTCTGDLSRNRQVGLRLGRGEKLEQITASLGMVAEGVKTTAAIYDLAKCLHVDAPLTEAVYSILYGNCDPQEVLHNLMSRRLRDE